MASTAGINRWRKSINLRAASPPLGRLADLNRDARTLSQPSARRKQSLWILFWSSCEQNICHVTVFYANCIKVHGGGVNSKTLLMLMAQTCYRGKQTHLVLIKLCLRGTGVSLSLRITKNVQLSRWTSRNCSSRILIMSELILLQCRIWGTSFIFDVCVTWTQAQVYVKVLCTVSLQKVQIIAV